MKISLSTLSLFLILWIPVRSLSADKKVPGFSVSGDIFQTSYFIENKGQFDRFGSKELPIQFALENRYDRVYFHPNGFVYHLYKRVKEEDDKDKDRDKDRKKGAVEEDDDEAYKLVEENVRFEWIGANPHPQIERYEQSSHYFTYGTAQYISYGYKKIVYKNLYPGIDVEFTLHDKGGFKYSLILHPGADPGRVKFTYKGKKVRTELNADGVLIHDPIVDLVERDLKAYDENGAPVACSYKLDKGILSLVPDGAYDRTKTLTIDPWVTPITTLTAASGNANNMGFDVDYDYSGNLYVFGGGYFDNYSTAGEPQKVAKYSPAGALLWTFNGTIPSIPWQSNANFGLAGNFIVDKLNTRIYVGQGYNTSGEQIIRLDQNGVYDGFASTQNGNFLEVWDFAFNCNTGYIFGLGGGISSNINMGAINPGNGSFTLYNYTGLGGFGQDVVSGVIDNNGSLYTLMASLIGTPSVNNVIYKLNAAFTGFVWQSACGYANMVEADNKPFVSANSSNGLNSLAVNNQYVFYYDGYNLRAFNAATGAASGTAISIAGQTAKWLGGIYADDCNHIYVGSLGGKIKVYTFDGSTFSANPDISLPGFSGEVYDIRFNSGNNLLYVSGKGYVGTVSPSFICNDTSALNISVSPVCNSSASVSVSNPSVGAQYTYTWADSASNTTIRTITTTATSDAISGLNQNQTYTVTVIKNQLCGGKLISKNFSLTCTPITTVINVSFCNGQSYTNNGVTYTTAGTFRDTLSSFAGLDSVLVINITVNNSSSLIRNVSVCNGQTYTVGSHTYSSNGTYKDTLTNSFGCDSIITTNLSILAPISSSQLVGICPNTSYSIGTHSYTLAGTYIDTLSSALGCDSVVTTTISLLPPVPKIQNISICTGGSYTINGHSYSAAGTYKDTIHNPLGCDTAYTTILSLLPPLSYTQNISICRRNTITVGIHTYGTSGTYKDTLHTAGGCDSIVTTNLTILPPVPRTQNIVICTGASYSINGHNYSSAGTYKDTLFSPTGCDTAVTTNLSLTPPLTYTQNISICRRNTITVGTHTYGTTGTYKDTLHTAGGCDSIVTTNLTILPPVPRTQNIVICTGASYSINGHTYSSAGTYKDTLISPTGCDTAVTTNLSLTPPLTYTQNVSICAGKSFSVGPHSYTLSGSYKDTLKTSGNCDSIVSTNMTVIAPVNTSQTRKICQGASISVGTHTYSVAGTYKDTFVSGKGCDSILTTTLIVHPLSFTSLNITLCHGKSYSVGTHTYNTSGIYKDTLKNSFGCDSIITTNLTIQPYLTSSNTQEICQGGSIHVGIHTYTLAGTYKDTMVSPRGCDSIVTTNLIVHPIPQVSQSIAICPGTSTTVGTHTYILAGTYKDTFSSIYGCDSIVTSMISILPYVTASRAYSICAGQSISIYGHDHNANGTFLDTLHAVIGCDSVISSILTVVPYPTKNLGKDTIICHGTSTLLDAGNAGSLYQWNTGDTTQSIFVSNAGSYTVDVNRENCITSDTIQIDVRPPLFINLGNDTVLCDKDSLILDASTPNGTYLWQDGSTYPSLVVYKEGHYSVLVRNECDSLTDEIEVDYFDCNCEFYIPNAFTPNNDGINDDFGVVNICDSLQSFKLEIYNRWGELLFKTNNPIDKWNGFFNNEASQVDDYIYVLYYRRLNKDFYKKGTVSLVR